MKSKILRRAAIFSSIAAIGIGIASHQIRQTKILNSTIPKFQKLLSGLNVKETNAWANFYASQRVDERHFLSPWQMNKISGIAKIYYPELGRDKGLAKAISILRERERDRGFIEKKERALKEDESRLEAFEKQLENEKKVGEKKISEASKGLQDANSRLFQISISHKNDMETIRIFKKKAAEFKSKFDAAVSSHGKRMREIEVRIAKQKKELEEHYREILVVRIFEMKK